MSSTIPAGLECYRLWKGGARMTAGGGGRDEGGGLNRTATKMVKK